MGGYAVGECLRLPVLVFVCRGAGVARGPRPRWEPHKALRACFQKQCRAAPIPRCHNIHAWGHPAQSSAPAPRGPRGRLPVRRVPPVPVLPRLHAALSPAERFASPPARSHRPHGGRPHTPPVPPTRQRAATLRPHSPHTPRRREPGSAGPPSMERQKKTKDTRSPCPTPGRTASPLPSPPPSPVRPPLLLCRVAVQPPPATHDAHQLVTPSPGVPNDAVIVMAGHCTRARSADAGSRWTPTKLTPTTR